MVPEAGCGGDTSIIEKFKTGQYESQYVDKEKIRVATDPVKILDLD